MVFETVYTVSEPRHPDFEKIYRQFMKRYCGSPDEECERGKRVYYAWLNKLGLDDTKPYRKPQEKFNWAKSAFTYWKQDKQAKYYKVEALFPLSSMNYNVYTEDELVAAARTLIGKPVNLNHDHVLRGITIVDAEYEDGAVECVLRVLKTAGRGLGLNICDMIDNKEILHVSIEAVCLRGIDYTPEGRKCKGLVFTGLALLTKDVLPGVPLTRIEPVEKIVENFKFTSLGEKDMVLNMKEEKNEEKEEPTTEEAPKTENVEGAQNEEGEPQTGESKESEDIHHVEPKEAEVETESEEDVKEREWDTAWINNLPDAAFAVIEPAYKRGETEDKRARHLPHHGPSVKDPDENGSVDIPHLRVALARANQIEPITDSINVEELRSKARAHLMRHARALLKTYQEEFDDAMRMLVVLDWLEELDEKVHGLTESSVITGHNNTANIMITQSNTATFPVITQGDKTEQSPKQGDETKEEQKTEDLPKESKEVAESKPNEPQKQHFEKLEEIFKLKEALKSGCQTKFRDAFWEIYRGYRKEGKSKAEAYRLTYQKVLKALES